MPLGVGAELSLSSATGAACTALGVATLKEPMAQSEVPRMPTPPASPQRRAGNDSSTVLGTPTTIDAVDTVEEEVAMEEIRQEVPPPQVSPPHPLRTIRATATGYVGEVVEDPEVEHEENEQLSEVASKVCF